MEFPFNTVAMLDQFGAQYSIAADEPALMQSLATVWHLPDHPHISKEQLIATARWKWRGTRTGQLCANNTVEDVRTITAAAFATTSERMRIGVLRVLDGVDWAMASVLLHFTYLPLDEGYPILDKRAMRAVGEEGSRYTYELWNEYTIMCREKAGQFQRSLRQIDRALWVFGG